ncbi:carbohydrate ABC transporter permease [Streptoalloteichus hindustanus]|uniref:Carbohydrate ABC transporter membrane protein 1, CUT1 family n=1 Tax=Streptoalloteichus hindustanus TaxID=2017 RepID=A0A1M5AKA9_STRHI|nr:sugar ABC transporter permease [Streptoalloteichus hindustanus]SHF30689.1 carbohydrate ABC transporter membrane protein 1, CUT1 family [Streptoalloteichus hindustanus]
MSRRSALRRAEARAALGFLSPWLVGFAVFTAGPLLASLWLSFTSYDAIGEPRWVGADNYRELARDPLVLKSLGNTLFYTVLHVPLTMALALGLASLLVAAGRWGPLFRTVFYVPAVTPPVAVGVLFLLLLNGQSGLVNRALRLFGVDGPQWTSDPAWIKPGIVLMGLWSFGTTLVIYYAALRNVPEQLYEAARLDGANAWQRFRHVTLPMISGALFFTLVVNTIASFQVFAEVYTMYFGTARTSAGAEEGLFYVVYLFRQAFEFLDMGYASALAWLLFLVILLVTLAQVRLSRRFVHYEGRR